jgi:hypothetical protein
MRARTAWSMMPPETLVLMKSCRIETELQYLFETIKCVQPLHHCLKFGGQSEKVGGGWVLEFTDFHVGCNCMRGQAIVHEVQVLHFLDDANEQGRTD